MPKQLARLTPGQLREVNKSRMQTVITSKREQNVLLEIAKETGLGNITEKIRDGLYRVVPKDNSACCNAPLRLMGLGAILHYVCHKCGKRCDTR